MIIFEAKKKMIDAWRMRVEKKKRIQTEMQQLVSALINKVKMALMMPKKRGGQKAFEHPFGRAVM